MAQIDCKLLLGVLSIALFVCITFGYDAPDYTGAFCERRSDPCCRDRLDSCAVPISTTLCYCDEFCDRIRNDDCCPDYKKVCLGIAPNPIISCLHNNQYFTNFTGPVTDNCNKCFCGADGRTLCEKYACLVDGDVIHNINRVSPTLGWSAGNYSEFWGRKFAEGLDLRLGTKQPNFHFIPISHKIEELPVNFNAFDSWPGQITPIKDQGWCGASWAISTSSIASDRFGIQSKGKENVDLASQQFLSCVRKQQGCHGGHLDAAWNYFRKTGLIEEECLPYTAKVQTCKIKPRDTLRTAGCGRPLNVPRTGLYKVSPAYSLNNETDIMTEIKKYGPVQATMKVYQDFFAYKSGIYRHSALSENEVFGYHSVRIVGWGEDRVGYQLVKYWLVANSWGTWWGENGFFRILRGNNECDIEKYIFAAWAHEYSAEKPQAVRRASRRN
jgi:hypothetical protein